MAGKAKLFAELYPDKIVSMVKIGPADEPTILIATERNIFQIRPGEFRIEIVRFVEVDRRPAPPIDPTDPNWEGRN